MYAITILFFKNIIAFPYIPPKTLEMKIDLPYHLSTPKSLGNIPNCF